MRLTAALRYRPFTKIIAISKAVASALEQAGVDSKRIVIIRSAVDTEAYRVQPDCERFRAELGIPGSATLIGAAGQLIARKGHRYLLEAAAGLGSRRGDVRIVIFGEGALAATLRAQSAALGLGEMVQFPGFREDLDNFIACLDILVHPALSEGLGVVTLKAAAAGVPVIGFAAGGLSEAVRDGETGLLVTPEDSRALRDAIEKLLDDPPLRARMGAAGRKRMQSDFSIATMTARHLSLYESVLHG